MSTLADRLRELRGTSSQAEMAKALGMKQPQWARYESGVSSPGVDVLVKICQVHAVSADWLLGITRPSSSPIRVNGYGNAVAIGTGAKASARTVHTAKRESDCCSKCPHKILADAVLKAAAK